MDRTAHMMKRASARNTLAFKIANGVFLTEADKASSKLSNEAKQGLALIRKGAGCTSLTAFIKYAEGKQEISRVDPIQKLIRERLQGVNNAEEAQEVIGSFALAYKNKDIGKMAEIVGIEKKAMSLILLWYVRYDQSVWLNSSAPTMERTAASRGYNKRYRVVKKVVTALFKISESTLSFVERITGGAADWLVRFIPTKAGKLVRRPIKWALLTGIAMNSLPAISQLATLSKSLFAASVLFLKTLVASHAILGPLVLTAGTVVAVLAYAWFGFKVIEYFGWAKKKLLEAIKLPFASLFLILKTAFKGGYKLISWAFKDIKGYIRENRALLT